MRNRLKNPLDPQKNIAEKKLRNYDPNDAEKQADEAIAMKKKGEIANWAAYFRQRQKDDVPESIVRRYLIYLLV